MYKRNIKCRIFLSFLWDQFGITIKLPVILKNPNFLNLQRMTEDYIKDIVNSTYCEDENFDHYMYEEVMKTFYGKNIFNWINDNSA